MRWVFSGIAIFSFLWVLLTHHDTPVASEVASTPAEAPVEDLSPAKSTKWDWKNVEEIYAFGDSWTTTNFKPDGDQPREENPMGNPPFPNDPNNRPPDWIEYLTGVHNQSFIKTFNLARGAATIDRDILMPLFPSTWCFDEQVHDQYERRYTDASHASTPPSNRLFIVLFGLVDIALLTREGPADDATIEQIMQAYEAALHRLYTAGARHLLLLNIPPIDRAPTPEFPLARFSAITTFNTALTAIAASLRLTYAADPLFSLKLFDLSDFMVHLLDDPSLMPQTAGIKNVTDNCWDYNPDVYNGVMEPFQSWDYLDAEKCGVRRDEYFWTNTLHVTHPVQEAIAAGVVGECFEKAESTLCS